MATNRTPTPIPTMRLEVREQNADIVEVLVRLGVPGARRSVAGSFIVTREAWESTLAAHSMGGEIPSNLEAADLWMTLPVEVMT